jgi:hypothetical protein
VDEFRTVNWRKIQREVEESGVFESFGKLELQN